MRRARVIGAVALAASLAAAPAALATIHHGSQRAVYSASGVAADVASCTPLTSVTINNTAYHPTGLGMNGVPLTVTIDGATRFVGAHGKVLSCASIKKNDRLVAFWNEPHGTPFVKTAPATRIVDLGPRLERFWIQGVAHADAICTNTESVTVDSVRFHPKGIGVNGTQAVVALDGATTFVGHRGHARACASITAHDVVRFYWTQLYGTPFAASNPATRVVILGHRGHHPA
jgi:hypothetical protein